ncbi:hypothetical protein CBL_14186 [Carabus blaptoides fortunei]
MTIAGSQQMVNASVRRRRQRLLTTTLAISPDATAGFVDPESLSYSTISYPAHGQMPDPCYSHPYQLWDVSSSHVECSSASYNSANDRAVRSYRTATLFVLLLHVFASPNGEHVIASSLIDGILLCSMLGVERSRDLGPSRERARVLDTQNPTYELSVENRVQVEWFYV